MMESQISNSESELLNPQNYYKFDNHGLVLADSIEDLLYDKFSNKKNRKKSVKVNELKSDIKNIFQKININNEIDNKIINNNDKKLKSIKNKGLNFINKDKKNNKNKTIKILININNKEKKKIEINSNTINSKKILYGNKNNIKSHIFYQHKINYKGLIPKKERLFITKTFKKKQSNKIKIISLPNSKKCYFTKKNKIIKKITNIPLKNVINNYYFCTKEKSISNSKKQKVYKMALRPDMIKNKEIDNSKNNNSPKIIIKIKNPSNTLHKYANNNFKTHLSRNLGKSKSCQKMKYNSVDKKEIKPLRIQSKKKIKNINKKRFTNIPFLKNKEIINAVYSKKQENFFYNTLNKKKNYSLNLNRNLRLKNISKSQNIIKTKSLGPEFNFISNVKHKLLNSQDKEKKIKRKKIRKLSSRNDGKLKSNLCPIKNRELNEKKDNNLKQKNNIRNNSLNKFSIITHFEFPAIDSYFY